MRIISFTESRNSLKVVWDNMINDADTTVIARRDSEDAVIMSLDYYNSLMETIHLLRSPAKAEHLNCSIEQFKASKASQRELLGLHSVRAEIQETGLGIVDPPETQYCS